MNEEELLQWINSLPVSVQQSMMQYMMAGGDPGMGGTAPFGAGPMNTGRLGGQLQGPLGVSPFDPMSVPAAYAYTPQLDSKGREQPFDLGTAQQNLNLIQDQQGTLFNNAMMMQGGEGVYAPGTFDTQYTPGEYDMLLQSALSQVSPDGTPTKYQAFIADRVAKGEDPTTALNNFWMVANDPENPASATLKASLPVKYVQVSDPVTGAPSMQPIEGGDMEAPQSFVRQLTEAQMKQGLQTPQYGEIAQDYIDKGIPFPTERYGEGQYSTEALVPGYAEAQAAFPVAHQQYLETREAADPKNIQQAQARFLTGAREASARTAPKQQTASASQPSRSYSGEANIGYGGNVNPNNLPLDPTTGEVVLPTGLNSTPSPNPNNIPLETAGITPSSRGVTPAPGMLPTTTGRSANRIAGTRARSSERAFENAKKTRRAAYREANSPDALFYNNMNAGLNASGRTPTQDTLMARQLVNYMMGVYGPRG